jgi:hypothetical protein
LARKRIEDTGRVSFFGPTDDVIESVDSRNSFCPSTLNDKRTMVFAGSFKLRTETDEDLSILNAYSYLAV